jgi:hypothetical protein
MINSQGIWEKVFNARAVSMIIPKYYTLDVESACNLILDTAKAIWKST